EADQGSAPAVLEVVATIVQVPRVLKAAWRSIGPVNGKRAAPSPAVGGHDRASLKADAGVVAEPPAAARRSNHERVLFLSCHGACQPRLRFAQKWPPRL